MNKGGKLNFSSFIFLMWGGNMIITGSITFEVGNPFIN